MKTKLNYSKSREGLILINVLVFVSIAIIITTSLVTWGGIMLKNALSLSQREQAFQIAEAGIDYYRWHLAHARDDFTDGVATTTNGPFIHDFKNKDGKIIGQFALTITPPTIGSTLVKIKSKGTVLENASVSRSIQVSVAIPSLAKYAMVTNSVVYYGSGDEVFGPIHSNAGVGFWDSGGAGPQPIVHNLVTASVSKLGSQLGVYTTVPPADPLPTTTSPLVPNRPDVFAGGRQFPVPVVDFTGLTSDLSSLKAKAQAAGFYRAASGVSGYKVVLKTNDTFDLYTVNSILPAPNNCTNSQNQTGWSTWSINTTGGATTLLGNYPFPANGIVFFEDHVWVEGQINIARITIAVGTFPVNANTNKNIIINDNLTYTNFDGSDVIGIIAQGNFLVGMKSADDLIIDGALVAQSGGTIRYYYNGNCKISSTNYGIRHSLTTFGMFASNAQGYFYYGSSGYTLQPASYDANLLYGPPPSFPLTSDQYSTISWAEVK